MGARTAALAGGVIHAERLSSYRCRWQTGQTKAHRLGICAVSGKALTSRPPQPISLVRFEISRFRDPLAEEFSYFSVLPAIPGFSGDLCTEGARTNPKLLAERSAEMSRIAEAPGKRDLGDRFPAEARVSQIVPALLQPTFSNRIAQGAAGGGEQSVQMANGDICCRRDLGGSQSWVR